MCRFVLYLGDPILLDLVISRPANSLIHQSFHAEMRQPLNGDGFGVAWYTDRHGPEPALFRAVTPAWNNQNLLHLSRVTESHCILAHVRSASPGMPVNEANCHPFSYGPFTFMHNGGVADFHRIKRSMVGRLSDDAYHAVQGTTDSAHLFGLFLDAWMASTQQDPLQRMADAMQKTIDQTIALLHEHDVGGASQFNIAVADGKRAVVCRHGLGLDASSPSLWWHQGASYDMIDGRMRMLEPASIADAVRPGRDAAIVASEPLTDDLGWQEVPSSSLVMIDVDRQVHVRRLAGTQDKEAGQRNVLDEAVGSFYKISPLSWHIAAALAPEGAEGASTLPHYTKQAPTAPELRIVATSSQRDRTT